jgi:putative acyl-CoA dehydrogenase
MNCSSSAEKRLAVITSQLSIVTHKVTNQVPLLEDFNSFQSNKQLRDCVSFYSTLLGCDANARPLDPCVAYGQYCGSKAALNDAALCNTITPQFAPLSEVGERIDSVKFHESYHRLMEKGVEAGVADGCVGLGTSQSPPWTAIGIAAVGYLHFELEQGTACPLTMTRAGVHVLHRYNSSGQFSEWIQKLTARIYDPRDVHISLKRGATLGMSMTEKQGGSDVQTNTTVAVLVEPDESDPTMRNLYSLRGHKWFTSAPMCDGFLTLAMVRQPEKQECALSCFLVPRWLTHHVRNTGFRVQRLKNKLGDRSNASSEVEYHGALGYLVGPIGQGVRVIIEMVVQTRLGCMIGSSALMEASLRCAIHHATHREAFGAVLIRKSLMRNVLCDLALEAEACTALSMRVTYAFQKPALELYSRIASAVGKYYITKRAPAVVYECLECLGGNGFVEDFPLARFYRQAPLNAIWEGSGNVMVLDVFRAFQKNPLVGQAVIDDIKLAGDDRILSRANAVLQRFGKCASDTSVDEIEGRNIVEELALLMLAAALRHTSPAEIYEAFVVTRLLQTGVRKVFFGTLPAEHVLEALIERHAPKF